MSQGGPEWEECLTLTGGRKGIPVIRIGDEVVLGFDRRRLERLIPPPPAT